MAKRTAPGAVANRDGLLFPNGAATRLLNEAPFAREALLDALKGTMSTGRASKAEIGGAAFELIPLFNIEGKADAAVACIVEDGQLPALLSELHSNIGFFGEIANALPAIVLTARPHGEIDYFSTRWYGYVASRSRRGLASSATFFAAIAFEDREAVTRAWVGGIQGRSDFSVEFRLRTLEGERWFELSATPLLGARGTIVKWIALLIDVHQKVAARIELSRSEMRFQLLAEAGKHLAGSAQPAEMASGVCKIATARTGDEWFCEITEGTRTVAFPELSDALRRSIADALEGHSVETLKPLVHTCTSGQRSVAVVGLSEFGQPDGFLGFAMPGSKDEIPPDRLTLLAEVSTRLGIALERFRSHQRDRLLAQTLQRAMLPLVLPKPYGIELDVAYDPAESDTLVGGDWYDSFELSDGCIAVAIGDVAGHGLGAALVMAQVRQAIRVAALEDPDPSSVLAVANRLLISEHHPMVTAHFGVLDPLSMSYKYAAAGHPPPLLVDGDGRVRALADAAMPLGVVEEFRADTHETNLEQNGALVLYTDGVVEDTRDILFGEDRLRQSLRRWARTGFDLRALELQAGLRTGLHRDDAAMFVVRFPMAQEFDIEVEGTLLNARRIRQAAQRFIANAGCSAEETFDATLAVGEAINNAVEHAYATETGKVRVTLRRERDAIVGIVRDQGTWRPPAAANGERGRGLQLLRTLATEVEIVPGPGGTTVRFRLKLERSSPQLRAVPLNSSR